MLKYLYSQLRFTKESKKELIEILESLSYRLNAEVQDYYLFKNSDTVYFLTLKYALGDEHHLAQLIFILNNNGVDDRLYVRGVLQRDYFPLESINFLNNPIHLS